MKDLWKKQHLQETKNDRSSHEPRFMSLKNLGSTYIKRPRGLTPYLSSLIGMTEAPYAFYHTIVAHGFGAPSGCKNIFY